MVDIVFKLAKVHLKGCIVKEGHSDTALAPVARLLRILCSCIVVAIDGEEPLLIIVYRNLFSLSSCYLWRWPQALGKDAAELSLDQEISSV